MGPGEWCATAAFLLLLLRAILLLHRVANARVDIDIDTTLICSRAVLYSCIENGLIMCSIIYTVQIHALNVFGSYKCVSRSRAARCMLDVAAADDACVLEQIISNK